MDIADRNGSLLRRWLRSADRLRDRAMLLGSFRVKTPGSRSSALLRSVTRPDQRFLRRVPAMRSVLRAAIRTISISQYDGRDGPASTRGGAVTGGASDSARHVLGPGWRAVSTEDERIGNGEVWKSTGSCLRRLGQKREGG